MCTFRASWCSACLSQAQVLAFAGTSVWDRKKKVGGGLGGTACTGGYKGVRAVQPELVEGGHQQQRWAYTMWFHSSNPSQFTLQIICRTVIVVLKWPMWNTGNSKSMKPKWPVQSARFLPHVSQLLSFSLVPCNTNTRLKCVYKIYKMFKEKEITFILTLLVSI